jgi:hypothetical protein
MISTPESTLTGDVPAVKRRKVRKGTQSCWECKRRKVRCLFTLNTNTTCDNCIRRKTSCVSQEYIKVEEMDLPKKRKEAGVEARLSRVEKMLHQLLQNQKADATHTPAFLPDDAPHITISVVCIA